MQTFVRLTDADLKALISAELLTKGYRINGNIRFTTHTRIDRVEIEAEADFIPYSAPKPQPREEIPPPEDATREEIPPPACAHVPPLSEFPAPREERSIFGKKRFGKEV